jgi:hypothetical protein
MPFSRADLLCRTPQAHVSMVSPQPVCSTLPFLFCLPRRIGCVDLHWLAGGEAIFPIKRLRRNAVIPGNSPFNAARYLPWP